MSANLQERAEQAVEAARAAGASDAWATATRSRAFGPFAAVYKKNIPLRSRFHYQPGIWSRLRRLISR